MKVLRFGIDITDQCKIENGVITLPDESPAHAKTAEEVEKAILDAADEHGFRVPYDGSNKFYDETAVNSFISGAKWMQDCTAIHTQPCQTGYSMDDIGDAFNAGRNYQRGEYEEYYGGPGNKYPDKKTYLASLTNKP